MCDAGEVTWEAARESAQSVYLLVVVAGVLVWCVDVVWLQVAFLVVAAPLLWWLRDPLFADDE